MKWEINVYLQVNVGFFFFPKYKLTIVDLINNLIDPLIYSFISYMLLLKKIKLNRDKRIKNSYQQS